MNHKEFYIQVAGWSHYLRAVERERKAYLDMTFKARNMRERGECVSEELEKQISEQRDKVEKYEAIADNIALTIHAEVDRVDKWLKEHPDYKL